MSIRYGFGLAITCELGAHHEKNFALLILTAMPLPFRAIRRASSAYKEVFSVS